MKKYAVKKEMCLLNCEKTNTVTKKNAMKMKYISFKQNYLFKNAYCYRIK